MLESISEKNGLSLLGSNDLRVYIVGVSTAGEAEIKMVKNNPGRKVVATTIDLEGFEQTLGYVKKQGFEGRIQLKLEDVAGGLPYPDNHFDFVYARLVLHYLDRNQQAKALSELYRILKKGKKIFVVVRSDNCKNAKDPKSIFDHKTGLTTFAPTTPAILKREKFRKRFFHNPESLREFIEKAGFSVHGSSVYKERLAGDYERRHISNNVDELIEMVGIK